MKYADALRLRLEIEQRKDQTQTGPAEQAKNLNWIAFLAVCAGDLEEAERAAKKCLEVYRIASSEKNEKYATYVMMLAMVLAESGKFDEAIAHGEEAVALFSQLHDEGDSFVEFRKHDIQRMRAKELPPYLER